MASPSGSFRLGPTDATLLITTGRTGPMAKMGHDLDIRVGPISFRSTEVDARGDLGLRVSRELNLPGTLPAS